MPCDLGAEVARACAARWHAMPSAASHRARSCDRGGRCTTTPSSVAHGPGGEDAIDGSALDAARPRGGRPSDATPIATVPAASTAAAIRCSEVDRRCRRARLRPGAAARARRRRSPGTSSARDSASASRAATSRITGHGADRRAVRGGARSMSAWVSDSAGGNVIWAGSSRHPGRIPPGNESRPDGGRTDRRSRR